MNHPPCNYKVFTDKHKTWRVVNAVKHGPLHLNMVIDAVIVYDRDDFFKKILGKLDNELEALGSERKRIGKLWYWVLKRDYKPREVIEL